MSCNFLATVISLTASANSPLRSMKPAALSASYPETSIPRKFNLEGDRSNIDIVMRRTPARDSVAAGGAENEEGSRLTLVSAPPAAAPKLVDRPRRVWRPRRHLSTQGALFIGFKRRRHQRTAGLLMALTPGQGRPQNRRGKPAGR